MYVAGRNNESGSCKFPLGVWNTCVKWSRNTLPSLIVIINTMFGSCWNITVLPKSMLWERKREKSNSLACHCVVRVWCIHNKVSPLLGPVLCRSHAMVSTHTSLVGVCLTGGGAQGTVDNHDSIVCLLFQEKLDQWHCSYWFKQEKHEAPLTFKWCGVCKAIGHAI